MKSYLPALTEKRIKTPLSTRKQATKFGGSRTKFLAHVWASERRNRCLSFGAVQVTASDRWQKTCWGSPQPNIRIVSALSDCEPCFCPKGLSKSTAVKWLTSDFAKGLNIHIQGSGFRMFQEAVCFLQLSTGGCKRKWRIVIITIGYYWWMTVNQRHGS